MPRARRQRQDGFRPKLIALSVAAAFTLSANQSLANPTGGSVASGSASFTAAGNTLTITNSANAIINWASFSIGVNEITRFLQSSSASAVLNRVVGSGGVIPQSVIDGILSSNGRVFLLNQSGVIVGRTATIDAAGFVASSLNLTDQDFLNGRMNFNAQPGTNPGKVSNAGLIDTTNAGPGGRVFLIAPDVENSGIIRTPQGQIVLAAGSSVELVQESSPFVTVKLTAGNEQALNLGSLISDSGRIDMAGALVRNTGVVAANSAVVGANGEIRLVATKDVTLDAGSSTTANGASGGKVLIQAQGGTALVYGNVSATGSSGTGGTVQALGVRVGVLGNGVIDASGATGGGTVLVGGDQHGANPDVQNAQQTLIGPDGVIRADAGTTGDGGRVIVWSDDTTQFYGNISARGGSQSGNGGFVETSGAQTLNFAGGVDTRAPMGVMGTLLLDPTEIEITAGGANIVPGSPNFASSGVLNSLLSDAIISATLTGTNVTVTTSTGDILIDAGVAIQPGLVAPTRNDNTLTLTSAGAITWAGSWTYTNGVSAGGGALTLNAAGGMTGGAGTLAVNGTAPLNLIASNGSINLNGSIVTQGGAVTIQTDPTLFSIGGGSAANISTNGGSITLTGANVSVGNLDTTVYGGSPTDTFVDITATNGNIFTGTIQTGDTAGNSFVSLSATTGGTIQTQAITTGATVNESSVFMDASSGILVNGSITTGGAGVSNNSNVRLFAASGDITVYGSILTGGSSSDSSIGINVENVGDINVTGTITTGFGSDSSISVDSGLGSVTTGNVLAGNGNSGGVNYYGQTGVTTGSITTTGGNGSSFVQINAPGGAVSTGDIVTGQSNSNGVFITSGSDSGAGGILTGNITTRNSVFSNSGEVSLSTVFGDIHVQGTIDSSGTSGNSDFTSGTRGGNVFLTRSDTSTTGQIKVDGNIFAYGGDAFTSSGASGGQGGSVLISGGQVNCECISSGTIFPFVGDVTVGGTIDTHGGSGAAGSVLSSSDHSGGTGGNVTIVGNGAISTGAIITKGGNGGDGGEGGFAGNGGTVSLTAGGLVQVASVDTSGGNGGQSDSLFVPCCGTTPADGGNGGAFAIYGGVPITITGSVTTRGGDGGAGPAGSNGTGGNGGNGGMVYLDGTGGMVQIGAVDVSGGGGGNGGSAYVIGGASDGGLGGTGGSTLGLTVYGSNISITGGILAYGGAGGAGGNGDPTSGIDGNGGNGGNAGAVTLTAPQIAGSGPIMVSGAVDVSSGAAGAAGSGGATPGIAGTAGATGSITLTGDAITWIADSISNYSITASSFFDWYPLTTGSITLTQLPDAIGVVNTPLMIIGSTAFSGPIRVNAPLSTTKNLSLVTTGNGVISQAGGAGISVMSLNAYGGTVTLTDPSNNVGTLQGGSPNSFSFTNAGPLTIATVDTFSGAPAGLSGNSVTLSAVGGIGQTAPVTVGSLSVHDSAGDINLTNSANSITNLTASSPTNVVVENGTGTMTVVTATAGNNLQLISDGINAGAMTATNLFYTTANPAAVISPPASFFSNAHASVIELGDTIFSNTGGISLAGAAPAGATALDLLTSGPVSSSGAITVPTLVAIGSSVTLNAANNVSVFTGIASAGNLSFNNSGSVSVAAAASGNVTLTSGGDLTGGAANSGTTSLTAAGAIGAPGSPFGVVATGLGAQAANGITIEMTSANGLPVPVSQLQNTATGDILLNAHGGVITNSLVKNNGGDVTINTFSPLTVSAGIDANGSIILCTGGLACTGGTATTGGVNDMILTGPFTFNTTTGQFDVTIGPTGTLTLNPALSASPLVLTAELFPNPFDITKFVFIGASTLLPQVQLGIDTSTNSTNQLSNQQGTVDTSDNQQKQDDKKKGAATCK